MIWHYLNMFKVVKFFKWLFIDLYRWFKFKLWEVWEGYGIDFYIGAFGTGKTISMVKYAKSVCLQFPQVKILTNLQLFNFPVHTIITHLDSYQQIIDCEPNTLILLDEMSTLLNSRNWEKGQITPAMLNQLLQLRKRRKKLICTAQRFEHVDKLIRDVTHIVIDCDTKGKRWTFNYHYDAYDWDHRNDMRPAKCVGITSFIQTDEIRQSYDTYELINKLVTETEYISDVEILEKQGSSQNIVVGEKPIKASILPWRKKV